MRAIAVVPAFREAGVIGATVTALRGMPELERVVVLDDCSGDGTAAEATAAGATVVVQSRNLGKGGSFNKVIPYLDFDVVLLMDGDLGEHAAEGAKLLAPVLKGEADLAIAAFPPASKKGGFGAAKGLASAGIKQLSGFDARSPLSGQRAMTRRAFEVLSPFDEGFGVEVGMTVDAVRMGLRVVEVDTRMSHRESGRDFAGFLHRGRQFSHIGRALARRARRGGGS